jgi:hypothetical protein
MSDNEGNFKLFAITYHAQETGQPNVGLLAKQCVGKMLFDKKTWSEFFSSNCNLFFGPFGPTFGPFLGYFIDHRGSFLNVGVLRCVGCPTIF